MLHNTDAEEVATHSKFTDLNDHLIGLVLSFLDIGFVVHVVRFVSKRFAAEHLVFYPLLWRKVALRGCNDFIEIKNSVEAVVSIPFEANPNSDKSGINSKKASTSETVLRLLHDHVGSSIRDLYILAKLSDDDLDRAHLSRFHLALNDGALQPTSASIARALKKWQSTLEHIELLHFRELWQSTLEHIELLHFREFDEHAFLDEFNNNNNNNNNADNHNNNNNHNTERRRQSNTEDAFSLPRLQSIHLFCYYAFGDGIVSFLIRSAGSQLNSISIHGARVGPQSFAAISQSASAPRIETLRLQPFIVDKPAFLQFVQQNINTPSVPSSLCSVLQSCKNLRVLDLSDMCSMELVASKDALFTLVNNCTLLEKLKIANYTSLIDGTEDKRLGLGRSKHEYESLPWIPTTGSISLPFLRKVTLQIKTHNVGSFVGSLLEIAPNLTNQAKPALYSTIFDDPFVSVLPTSAARYSLTSINLDLTEVTNAGIVSIMLSCPRLKRLSFGTSDFAYSFRGINTNITSDAFAHFKSSASPSSLITTCEDHDHDRDHNSTALTLEAFYSDLDNRTLRLLRKSQVTEFCAIGCPRIIRRGLKAPKRLGHQWTTLTRLFIPDLHATRADIRNLAKLIPW